MECGELVSTVFIVSVICYLRHQIGSGKSSRWRESGSDMHPCPQVELHSVFTKIKPVVHIEVMHVGENDNDSQSRS